MFVAAILAHIAQDARTRRTPIGQKGDRISRLSPGLQELFRHLFVAETLAGDALRKPDELRDLACAWIAEGL